MKHVLLSGLDNVATGDRLRKIFGLVHQRNFQEVRDKKSHLGMSQIFHGHFFVVEVASGLLQAGAGMYLSDET